jgi:hypothetical protein
MLTAGQAARCMRYHGVRVGLVSTYSKTVSLQIAPGDDGSRTLLFSEPLAIMSYTHAGTRYHRAGSYQRTPWSAPSTSPCIKQGQQELVVRPNHHQLC